MWSPGGLFLVGFPDGVINVVFGALIVALIPMASVLLGVAANIQQLIYGAVIVIASALTMRRRS